MDLLWNRAENPISVFVLAHGAGAGMDSEFMETMAALLCDQGITVVRFEFPYMRQRRETGSRRPPDRQPKLLDCWQEALDTVLSETKLPLHIGGKSMGGRMASLLAAGGADVEGVICLGYPFYATGKQDKPRIDHLPDIQVPVLILQGERDTMGNIEVVTGYELSDRVKISWFADGNHDLKPGKASGFNQMEYLIRGSREIRRFIEINLILDSAVFYT